jgi:hypothetical protein
MNKSKLMDPVEFRFTDPQDVEQYGDRWYRYAEEDLARFPARTLIELEGALGMPIVDVMNGMRASTVLGDTAAAWIGVRAVDPQLAGGFDSFNPLTLLIEWRPAREGKAPATTAPEDAEPVATQAPPDGGSPEEDPSQSRTSAPTDTVTLPILPVVG